MSGILRAYNYNALRQLSITQDQLSNMCYIWRAQRQSTPCVSAAACRVSVLLLASPHTYFPFHGVSYVAPEAANHAADHAAGMFDRAMGLLLAISAIEAAHLEPLEQAEKLSLLQCLRCNAF